MRRAGGGARRGLGRRGDEAARGLGAGALRLPLRQESALDIAPDFVELRLIERRFVRRGLRFHGRRRAKQRPKRGENGQAAIPARTNHTIQRASARPSSGRGKSPGSVIAKRSLGLVKMEGARANPLTCRLAIARIQSGIRPFPRRRALVAAAASPQRPAPVHRQDRPGHEGEARRDRKHGASDLLGVG